MLDAKGVSQFHLIQPRIANTDPNSIAHLTRSAPVVYFAFDLLYLDGYDLRNVPLSERKELLQEVLGVAPGSVTPFAVMNDRDGRVAVVIDDALMAFETINAHPLENIATTNIARSDLLEFIRACGHVPRVLYVGQDPPANSA